jgi:integrase
MLAACATAFYAGLRLGELRELRWREVDFARSIILVRSASSAGQRTTTKGGRVRSVPLVDALARRLEGWSRQTSSSDDDYVFGDRLGRRLDEAAPREAFYAGLLAAGMGHRRDAVDKHGESQRPIKFHDLRHSYCSWAVGVWNIAEVRDFAGHQSIQTTSKYLHSTIKAEHAAKADAALAAMMAGGTATGDLPHGAPA